jgi:hypothetical protein
MRFKPQDLEEDADWQAAQSALFEARKLPFGTERYQALKKAGQLRFEADRRRSAKEQEALPEASSGRIEASCVENVIGMHPKRPGDPNQIAKSDPQRSLNRLTDRALGSPQHRNHQRPSQSQETAMPCIDRFGVRWRSSPSATPLSLTLRRVPRHSRRAATAGRFERFPAFE